MEARPEDVAAPVEETIVDAGLYIDGRRVASSDDRRGGVTQLPRRNGSLAWIGLFRPTEAQFLPVAEEFGLHELAVEDAIVAHQRPKLERYGDALFVVLRAATYLDEDEEVEFGEIHVFVGPNFVLTVRHSRTPDLGLVRHRMENDPELLALGPEAVLYADPRQRRRRLRAGRGRPREGHRRDRDPGLPRRPHGVATHLRALGRGHRVPALDATPARRCSTGSTAGFDKYGTDEELQRYLRDVADHATTVVERVDNFRQMLSDILTVNATLVSQAQNEEVKRLTEASFDQNEEIKRISAWAAIIFAPTLIGTIYGMNFDIPELHWAFGYPFALGLMVVVSVALWLIFRRRGWL